MKDFKESDKLKQALKKFDETPIEVGEQIYWKKEYHKVLSINVDDTLTIQYYHSKETIKIEEIEGRLKKWKVGANHFLDDSWLCYIRHVNFAFESIMFSLGLDGHDINDIGNFKIKDIPIQKLNWNPFVVIDNKKKYYQRDFVWALEDKQLLIDSIYNNISCGSIVVRKRSFDELEKHYAMGERELFFYDVVDGKQRLKTMQEFLNSGFCDSFGDYYSDLSADARNKLFNHQLFSYFEIKENVSDDFVLQQFLKVNFTGKPQSTEHINYVKKLYKESKGESK